MLVFAHRGASADAPENTLAAFLLAAEQGAEGIELDVRRTTDGQLLVVHDPIAGTRADYPSQPTLDEVFATVGTRFACINVELKEAGLEAEVLDSIARHGVAEQVLFSSFLPETLRVCRQLSPEIPVARLFSRTLTDDIEEWEVLHPHYALVTEATMALWAGKQVNVWTVNEPDEMRRLAALGVDGLITDHPALAAGTIRA